MSIDSNINHPSISQLPENLQETGSMQHDHSSNEIHLSNLGFFARTLNKVSEHLSTKFDKLFSAKEKTEQVVKEQLASKPSYSSEKPPSLFKRLSIPDSIKNLFQSKDKLTPHTEKLEQPINKSEIKETIEQELSKLKQDLPNFDQEISKLEQELPKLYKNILENEALIKYWSEVKNKCEDDGPFKSPDLLKDCEKKLKELETDNKNYKQEFNSIKIRFNEVKPFIKMVQDLSNLEKNISKNEKNIKDWEGIKKQGEEISQDPSFLKDTEEKLKTLKSNRENYRQEIQAFISKFNPIKQNIASDLNVIETQGQIETSVKESNPPKLNLFERISNVFARFGSQITSGKETTESTNESKLNIKERLQEKLANIQERLATISDRFSDGLTTLSNRFSEGLSTASKKLGNLSTEAKKKGLEIKISYLNREIASSKKEKGEVHEKIKKTKQNIDSNLETAKNLLISINPDKEKELNNKQIDKTIEALEKEINGLNADPELKEFELKISLPFTYEENPLMQEKLDIAIELTKQKKGLEKLQSQLSNLQNKESNLTEKINNSEKQLTAATSKFEAINLSFDMNKASSIVQNAANKLANEQLPELEKQQLLSEIENSFDGFLESMSSNQPDATKKTSEAFVSVLNELLEGKIPAPDKRKIMQEIEKIGGNFSNKLIGLLDDSKESNEKITILQSARKILDSMTNFYYFASSQSKDPFSLGPRLLGIKKLDLLLSQATWKNFEDVQKAAVKATENINMQASMSTSSFAHSVDFNNYGIRPEKGSIQWSEQSVIFNGEDKKIVTSFSFNGEPHTFSSNANVIYDEKQDMLFSFNIYRTLENHDQVKQEKLPSGAVLMTLCDGCGQEKNGTKAAKGVIAAAHNDAAQRFSGIENSHQALNRQIESVKLAQQSLLESSSQENGDGATTFVQAYIQGGVLSGVLVGDAKLFVIRPNHTQNETEAKNWECLDIMQNPRERVDARDPGGRLSGLSEQTELDAITGISFQLQKGDIVMIASDGVPDCFDPDNLKNTPGKSLIDNLSDTIKGSKDAEEIQQKLEKDLQMKTFEEKTSQFEGERRKKHQPGWGKMDNANMAFFTYNG